MAFQGAYMVVVGRCSLLTPAPGAALCGVSAVGHLGSILAPPRGHAAGFPLSAQPFCLPPDRSLFSQSHLPGWATT